MTAHNSSFLRVLNERGYVHQITDAAALDVLALSGPVTGYIGFDCTAPSLHVGNLVSIMLLRRMQQTGHRPIVLMGGGTSKVGDPSGKDASRTMLDQPTLDANKASIRRIFERFLTFGDGPSDAIMLDNDDWLAGLAYIPFLRDVGQHFSVNAMLKRDSVQMRLEREQNLSFLEFNYMILQAYDFLELFRRENCRLQMGGSDQWGNIVGGIDLTRRMAGAEVYGVTTPLITTADGAKMGKTAAGAVWLHEDSLPTWDYWQFWRNTDDRDVGKFLRLFTDLPLAEIARLEALQGAEINAAKIELANAATALCRGQEAAAGAAETARATFEDGASGEDLPTLVVSGSISILDATTQLGFASSKGEARRKIREGAVRIDGVKVTDENLVITITQPTKLSLGTKRHGMLKPS